MNKKTVSVLLLLSMLFSVITGSVFSTSASKVETAPVAAAVDAASVGTDYGLASKVEDGNILHCFDWSLSQIKEELPNIAKAGFTSVQTSPLQPHTSQGNWYWLYQPTGFSIGNELGSYNDLKSLCSEADKYGIKIIVDVVANHLAGWNDGSWNDGIDGSLRNGDYFHNQGACNDWNNRYDVTHKNIGMPDLNSEHGDVQNKVAEMIRAMKSAGVDGIRWDAAKHIGLPSEGCGFWSTMASIGMYNYGEILDNPAGDSGDDYNNSLIQEYAGLIGVTDSSYSGHITGCIRDGQVSNSTGHWTSRGVPANRIVLWGESHDTFCNRGWTNGLNENTIDRSYAILGARANSQTLYFSRPYEKDHDRISVCNKGSTHFTTNEVAAVNHFHNAMVGTKEYFTTGNNCYVICREGGAVIVAASGSDFDVTVPNGGSLVPSGEYTDEVSGSKWTVDGSNIRGHIGGTGIAVIYQQGEVHSAEPRVTATPGSCAYRTDTLNVLLNFSNATSATYSVDGGAFKSFKNGQSVTIGKNLSYGTTTTLVLKATNGTSETRATYTYTKTDPNAGQTVYFDNSSYNWSAVYCYMYNDSGSNGDWPGIAMTKGADNVYYYDVPPQFKNAKVLFAESSYANENRYPSGGDPGMDINGESMMFGSNHSWTSLGGSSSDPTTSDETQPQSTQPQATQPVVVVPAGKILVGDADQDGSVTILDATSIQRHLASMRTFSAKALACADSDRDGGVTILDATAIQRHLAGLHRANNLIGTAADPVQSTDPGQDDPQPSQPIVVPSGAVVLNASATSEAPEAWYAWTWNDGDGRWVRGEGAVNAIVFKGLDANVIFVRANPDMDIDWNNGSVWNQTNDVQTREGGTFVTSGWQAQRIAGDWA